MGSPPTERMLVHRLLLVAGVMVLAALGPAPASAQTQTLFLDFRDPGKDRYAKQVTTKKLRVGLPYVVNVRGTLSFYKWRTKDVACGTAEKKPIYRSRRANGIVGANAEFVFADKARAATVVPGPGTASPKSGSASRSAGAAVLQALADHPDAHAAARSRLRLAIMGYGKRAKFRLKDRNTRDNYGRLRLRLRRATATNCTAGKHAAWGFATEAECASKALPA